MTAKNYLTHEKFYMLAEWLKKQDTKQLDGKSFADVAKLATTALGFSVSGYSVDTASQSAGVKWYQPRRNTGGNLNKRVERLEEKLERLVAELGGEASMGQAEKSIT